MTYTNDDPTADPDFLEWKRLKADREAVAALEEAQAEHTAAINDGIRGARSEAELAAYLHEQNRTGNLPGLEQPPRQQGTGIAPTPAEIKACRSEAELSALMQERFGDSTASELGLVRQNEL